MTIAALAPFRSDPVRRPLDDEFSRLYRSYRPQLLRYVTHHFGPRDADEITQESLTRALRSMDTSRSEAETWAWLVRVARNVAHDLARSRRICDATEDGAMPADDVCDDAILPEPAALLDEKRRLVRHALKTLPPSQRRILVLYEVDELNCPAIARLMGSTEDAVRKALQRARRRFAAEMRALTGGSFGSVVLWLRRRVLKAAPATSASTALVAIVGTVAISVSISPAAPERLLSPSTTSPASVSAPDLDHGRVGGETVRVTGHRASRGTARTPVAPPEATPLRVSVPDTFGSEDSKQVQDSIDVPVVGPVDVEAHLTVDDDPGFLCTIEPLKCEGQ